MGERWRGGDIIVAGDVGVGIGIPFSYVHFSGVSLGGGQGGIKEHHFRTLFLGLGIYAQPALPPFFW